MSKKIYNYPNIKRKDKNNCKLTDLEISEIKDLFEQGISMRQIANIFNINPITVKYWVDEEYRSKDKKRVQDKLKKIRATEDGKKMDNKRRAEELYSARHRIPSLKQFHEKELDVLHKKSKLKVTNKVKK